MDKLPNHKLNQLLRDAFPAMEVSPDFTLQLWRRLMKEPLPTFWPVPAAAAVVAAVFGIAVGLWSWGRMYSAEAGFPSEARSAVAQVERLDLFGNAPHDTLAGSILRRMEGGSA